MGFLKNEDYEELPADDGEAFAKLEAISRDRLHQVERDINDCLSAEDMLNYMNEISALAHEFEIPNISYDEQPDHYLNEFARFTRAVDFRLAQIRVQRARRDQRGSVVITGATREKIQHHLERLKEEVSQADLPEKRKRSLLDKIGEFEVELTKRRINLVAVMTVVALVSSVVHDNAETLVDAPKIMQTISALFGKAKSEEEEAVQRLPKPAPFKAIPDMRKASDPHGVNAFDGEEIPF